MLILNPGLDLYVCLRPVRYFDGVPTPTVRPEEVDIAFFRENTEDLYAGMEFKLGTAENKKFLELLKENFADEYQKIAFPDSTSVGIKPISIEGTERLVRGAINWALRYGRQSVTLVHNRAVMKQTEGAFMEWGYRLAKAEFRDQIVTALEAKIIESIEAQPDLSLEERIEEIIPNFGALPVEEQAYLKQEVAEALELRPALGEGKWRERLLVKDALTDIVFQNILLKPDEYDVIATMNLNGDYLSDAVAALVGGIGIAPGANINYETGHAIFEATHGTAPKYTDLDKVNPGSVILSGEMMFRYMDWNQAADLIIKGLSGAIAAKTVTYDFERLTKGATLLKCSEFGDAIIQYMDD